MLLFLLLEETENISKFPDSAEEGESQHGVIGIIESSGDLGDHVAGVAQFTRFIGAEDGAAADVPESAEGFLLGIFLFYGGNGALIPELGEGISLKLIGIFGN